MQIYIDGKFYSKEDAKISVFDHCLLYGDGVFEGIRIYHNRIFKLDDHLRRLFKSALYINLDIGMQFDELRQATLETARRNGLRDGYIRLIVTRGAGTLGLSPWLCPKPTIIIIVDQLTLYPKEMYEHGTNMVTASTRRNLNVALAPQVKTCNYLNNVLAKMEAKHAGATEALMLNDQGYVAEAAADNLFIVRGVELATPALYLGALPGITRAVAMELAAQQNIPTQEACLTLFDLYTAEECFLTGTAAEIIPVIKLDDRMIGEGVPGPITRTLMKKFKEYVQHEGVEIPA